MSNFEFLFTNSRGAGVEFEDRVTFTRLIENIEFQG